MVHLKWAASSDKLLKYSVMLMTMLKWTYNSTVSNKMTELQLWQQL